MPRTIPWRWAPAVLLTLFVTLGPYLAYRASYAEHKRLRVVKPGVLYRSGQMTVAGFRDAIACFGIKTIINLQDEYPDPDLDESFWSFGTMKETDLCQRLGVRYVYIQPDLIPRRQVPAARPRSIEKFLAVMDDPENYPVLIHCKAGLHRTGVMNAVYRMEYENQTPRQAVEELRMHGFGDFACTGHNDYIQQYILSYRRGVRQTAEQAAAR